MIEMEMTEQDVSLDGRAGSKELLAERHDPAPAIKDEDVLAAANFHAGCIAAITDRIRAGTWDGAARAPKVHIQARGADRFYASVRERFISNLGGPLHVRSFAFLS